VNAIEKVILQTGGFIVSEGTLRPQDLFPKFLGALEELSPKDAEDIRKEVPPEAWSDENHEWWSSEDCSWTLNEGLFDLLNTHAPGGYYFGSNEGDGACFGFWAIDEREEEP
jgi:hypothetical protein